MALTLSLFGSVLFAEDAAYTACKSSIENSDLESLERGIQDLLGGQQSSNNKKIYLSSLGELAAGRVRNAQLHKLWERDPFDVAIKLMGTGMIVGGGILVIKGLLPELHITDSLIELMRNRMTIVALGGLGLVSGSMLLYKRQSDTTKLKKALEVDSYIQAQRETFNALG